MRQEHVLAIANRDEDPAQHGEHILWQSYPLPGLQFVEPDVALGVLAHNIDTVKFDCQSTLMRDIAGNFILNG